MKEYDQFVAVLDDAMAALDKNGIGQREKEEVLAIFFSMKGDIVRVWFWLQLKIYTT